MSDKLAEILLLVKGLWTITQTSVETNPNHLTSEVIQILKDAGTNRLSVGVQSFNDEILKSIERFEKCGSGEQIKEKLSSIAGMFDTINIDMIFNFPNQTKEMLIQDTRIIKEIKADQITYYPLMLSDTRKDEVTERCGSMNYRQEEQLYKLIVNELTDTYNQNSIWCFSSKKSAIDEYIVDYDEYAGVGVGSFGYINGTMYSNTFSIQRYIELIQKGRHPVVATRKFSCSRRIRYDLLLKLLEGSLNPSAMKKKYGKGFWFYLCKELLFLLAIRAITFQDNNIILTARGRYYWLIIMRTFFSVVGDYRNIHTSSDTPSST